MSVTKEKNLIKFSTEQGKTYTLDINTGNIYGIKNTVLKRPPKTLMSIILRKDKKIANHWKSYFWEAVHGYLTNIIESQVLLTADKINSLKVEAKSLHVRDLKIITENFPSFIKYIKVHNNQYDYYEFTCFCQQQKYSKYLSIYGEVPDDFLACLDDYSSSISKEQLELYFYYGIKQKMINLFAYPLLIHFVTEYCKQCKQIGKEPKKESNALREFAETKQSYQIWKGNQETTVYNDFYQEQKKAWEFLYDNLMIVIPKNSLDLIKESQNMHNCVSTYDSKIQCHNTYICFIRKQNLPNFSYITCEISKQGKILQFLGRFNQIPNKWEENFKNKYQEYLNSIWNR